MKKKGIIILSLLIIPVMVSADDTMVIVCTTTALETLAEAVGGEKVDVVSLVQPGVCPSHFDVRPSHVAEVSQASVILYHGVEPWLEDLITASQNETVQSVQLSSPWNTPALAIQKIEAIQDVLSEADPENAEYYKENAEKAIQEINAAAESILENVEPLGVDQVPVLCMEWQKSFVEWMGFNVVGSYAPPETLSIKDVNDLLATGRAEGAALVIDNLQSGTDMGSELAAEIHAQHVVLTNFPNAVPETETIAKMLEYNGRQILDAVKKYQEEKGKISELESKLEEEIWKKQLFEVIAAVLVVLCIAEAVVLYMKRE
jgi:ABC-type Zn uptake system ZnuABC Zn-binding protein ZnuA